jgi:hypothetical protein
MTQLSPNSIAALLIEYGFELDRSQAPVVVNNWLQQYDNQWVVWAIVEAIYRNSSKVISVDRILEMWQRSGKARHRFTMEYEQQILGKSIFNSTSASTPTPTPKPKDRDLPPVNPIVGKNNSPRRAYEKLDPEVIPPAMVDRDDDRGFSERYYSIDRDRPHPPAETPHSFAASNHQSHPNPEPPPSVGDANASPPPPSTDKLSFEERDVSPFFHRLKSIVDDEENTEFGEQIT